MFFSSCVYIYSSLASEFFQTIKHDVPAIVGAIALS